MHGLINRLAFQRMIFVKVWNGWNCGKKLHPSNTKPADFSPSVAVSLPVFVSIPAPLHRRPPTNRNHRQNHPESLSNTTIHYAVGEPDQAGSPPYKAWPSRCLAPNHRVQKRECILRCLSHSMFWDWDSSPCASCCLHYSWVVSRY